MCLRVLAKELIDFPPNLEVFNYEARYLDARQAL